VKPTLTKRHGEHEGEDKNSGDTGNTSAGFEVIWVVEGLEAFACQPIMATRANAPMIIGQRRPILSTNDEHDWYLAFGVTMNVLRLSAI